MHPMNRREAVKTTGVLLSGVLITSSGLTACRGDSRKIGAGVLNADDQALLEEIADTLLPTTPNSPGAKVAGGGPVINPFLPQFRGAPPQKEGGGGVEKVLGASGGHPPALV